VKFLNVYYNENFKIISFKGLYSGLNTNVKRNYIMNSAEFASYDHFKSTILSYLPSVRSEDVRLHFVILYEVYPLDICESPADVLKTRLMNVIIKNIF